ncbi:MAG TPA: thiopurine S-methyltransferase [Methylococcus sp.]|nr:thiopurine S-methyltransferase [Methylococcus sp.]
MDPTFWHERWQQHQIGFHQLRVNPLLQTFWHPCIQQNHGTVFVPLCGKSLDMVWLSQQGHGVLGVEISPIAVKDFFREQGIQPIEDPPRKPFRCFQSQRIRLLCGDFFDLTPDWVSNVEAVYDRAALVALPPELQKRYASKLLEILPHRPPIFLITLEYDPSEMAGPPFTTPEETVFQLFGEEYWIAPLATRDVLTDEPGLQGRGLSRLVEKAYWLHKRDDDHGIKESP